MSNKTFSNAKLVDKITFLETFRDLDPSMPVSEILFLLAAARQPESSMKQLADSAGIPYASASRYLTGLSGGRPAVGVEGLGLLETAENPMDRKFKIISLTEQGSELLAQII